MFGVLSDRIGRKFGMVFASMVLVVFSILAAGAWGAGGSTHGLFRALQAYRFILGIAIGAEYPAGESISCYLITMLTIAILALRIRCLFREYRRCWCESKEAANVLCIGNQ